MAAYLVADVDDLLRRFRSRGFSIDIHELATRLRGSAALAAGLLGPDELKSIAVADWSNLRANQNGSIALTFETVGFETFNTPDRQHLADSLVIQYFSADPDPVDELIIVTTAQEMISLIKRVKLSRSGRVRVWSDTNQRIDGVIFQPLESILGIQAKSVALYIDFENIAISLNEQGYLVNLDKLIEGLQHQAGIHGQITRMAAYAPWGQRGALPPLVDDNNREVSDDAPSRLAMANIDPVFNLPGKNSADMRIAKDVLADSGQPNAPDIFVIASGDRDFNDVFTALRTRNKQVIVWGVRGSIARLLENNPAIQVEYLDDFLDLRRHETLGHIYQAALPNPVSTAVPFTPSQWSSVVLQYDRLMQIYPGQAISEEMLGQQLREMNDVVSDDRAHDLISQAVLQGILRLAYQPISGNGNVTEIPLAAVAENPIVEKTRLIRDRIVLRVANTLEVRNWEYVNYGFLLKGIAMDRALERPGLNLDDSWRSDWIDSLVREGILAREMVPHRHNPEDLVPVIKLGKTSMPTVRPPRPMPVLTQSELYDSSYDDLEPFGNIERAARDEEVDAMMKRIIVSVDQFTSYRGFTWCPLGSLHRRLRPYDSGVVFQRAVEWLIELRAAEVGEYDNPQSAYKTKGISLETNAELSHEILTERDQFILALLSLYDQHLPINFTSLQRVTNLPPNELELWASIMQVENVLNPVQGKPGLYSLFRTHHTVNLIADNRDKE
jgi:hypothetical protein